MHYRVSLSAKGRKLVRAVHKSNPRLDTGMHRVLRADKAAIVTTRQCWLDDEECYYFSGKRDELPRE